MTDHRPLAIRPWILARAGQWWRHEMPPYDRWIPTCVGMTYAHRQATESKPLDSRGRENDGKGIHHGGKALFLPDPLLSPSPLAGEGRGEGKKCPHATLCPTPPASCQCKREARFFPSKLRAGASLRMTEEGKMTEEGGMAEDTPYTCTASALDSRSPITNGGDRFRGNDRPQATSHTSMDSRARDSGGGMRCRPTTGGFPHAWE